jgi:hypothetical protein
MRKLLRNNRAARQLFDEAIEELPAVIVGLDENPFVLAVCAPVVRVAHQPRDTVSGNARGPQVFAVRGAGARGRGRRAVADGVRGGDLDQLFIDVVRELLLGAERMLRLRDRMETPGI